MFWAALMARALLGGVFLVFGLNHFFSFLTMPAPEFPDRALQFVGALGNSRYMDAVKVLEVVGGALVLSGRLVPLGLVLLTPVAVNILFFDLFLVGKAGLGVPLVALCAALAWVYRSHFAGLFAVKPKIG